MSKSGRCRDRGIWTWFFSITKKAIKTIFQMQCNESFKQYFKILKYTGQSHFLIFLNIQVDIRVKCFNSTSHINHTKNQNQLKTISFWLKIWKNKKQTYWDLNMYLIIHFCRTLNLWLTKKMFLDFRRIFRQSGWWTGSYRYERSITTRVEEWYNFSKNVYPKILTFVAAYLHLRQWNIEISNRKCKIFAAPNFKKDSKH